MRTLIASLALLFALSGAAYAQPMVSFSADANGQINFVMPSKNVGCTYTPPGGTPVYKPFDGGPELACDRIAPKYVRVVLTPKSLHRFDDVGDQGCCGAAHVFPYGSRWQHGPFSCDSAETGLTCRRADGSGFSVSRAGIILY
jgi:hypothetical protein